MHGARAPRFLNAEMVAVFASNSTFWRLTTKAFLPSSASCFAVLSLSCSMFNSKRRVDMANSARNWSLSARISSFDRGVDASIRRMVRRSARL